MFGSVNLQCILENTIVYLVYITTLYYDSLRFSKYSSLLYYIQYVFVGTCTCVFDASRFKVSLLMLRDVHYPCLLLPVILSQVFIKP